MDLSLRVDDWVKEWKFIRSIVKTGDSELDFETAFKIITKKMEEENNKFAKISDFEGSPKVVECLAFERVKGKSKFVDKFGFSNLFTFRMDGEERVLDNSSYGFYKEFEHSGLRSGDLAMVFSLGFSNQETGQKYRWWIFQKLDPAQSNPI